MFYAIINTDNDTIARYDTEDEANTELAYYDDEHTVVEYFPYFYDLASDYVRLRCEDARYWRNHGTTAGMIRMRYVLDQLAQYGITQDDVVTL